MYSLIVAVYKNQDSIGALLNTLESMDRHLGHNLEVVFVVDGSPDQSYLRLATGLRSVSFRSQLISLSRNYGSIAATRAGLSVAKGRYFAVMAADLQEPTSLAMEFFRILTNEPIDLVFGVRESREDPVSTRMASAVFWFFYRRWIQPEVPEGGVDTFGCNQMIREHILNLRERNTSMIGQLFWLGFRRKYVSYKRLERESGISAWTLRRKLRYFSDSVFTFSDVPVQILLFCGLMGVSVALIWFVVVFVAKVYGAIAIAGYTQTVLTILFFAGLNSLGLGIIGSYVWRAFENTKGRPEFCILSQTQFDGKKEPQ